MTNTRFYPADSKVRAQDYDPDGERVGKSREVADFSKLRDSLIEVGDFRSQVPDLMAAAVAEIATKAYELGYAHGVLAPDLESAYYE